MIRYFLTFLAFLKVSIAFTQAPGCPSIEIGAVDTIDCFSDPCVELTSTFLQTGETSTYEVDSIQYAPPFPFTGGTPLFIGIDDIFSDTIQLPFEFCFFGNTYDFIIIGANGVLSFDIANAGGFVIGLLLILFPQIMLVLFRIQIL